MADQNNVIIRKQNGDFTITLASTTDFDDASANSVHQFWKSTEPSFIDERNMAWERKWRIEFQSKDQRVVIGETCFSIINGQTQNEKNVAARLLLPLNDFEVIHFGPGTGIKVNQFEIVLAVNANKRLGKVVFKYTAGFERYASVLKSKVIDNDYWYGKIKYIRLLIKDYPNCQFFDVPIIQRILSGEFKVTVEQAVRKFVSEQRTALHEEDKERDAALAALRRNNCTVNVSYRPTVSLSLLELVIFPSRRGNWDVEEGMKLKLSSSEVFDEDALDKDDDDLKCWTAYVVGFKPSGILAIVLNNVSEYDAKNLHGRMIYNVKVTVLDDDRMGDRMSTALRRLENVLMTEIDPNLAKASADSEDIVLKVPGHRLLIKHQDIDRTQWVAAPIPLIHMATRLLYNDKWALKPSHRQGIEFIIGGREIVAIHGPPGTGKTTFITKVAALLKSKTLIRGNIVLTANANAATLVILQKCIETFPLFDLNPAQFVVLVETPGTIARRAISKNAISNELKPYTLEHRVDQLAKRYPEKYAAYCKFHDAVSRNGNITSSDKIEYLKDRSLLWREIRGQKSIFISTVAAMNTEFYTRAYPNTHPFEVGAWICDEASQCPVPAFVEGWLTLNPKHLVIAGDMEQLQAFTRSNFASGIWARSPLWYAAQLGPQHGVLLDVQFRMPKHLYDPISTAHYQGLVMADESTENRAEDIALRQKISCIEICPTGDDKYWIRLSHDFFIFDVRDGQKTSWGQNSAKNMVEVGIVKRLSVALLDAGVASKDLMLMSPYHGQYRMIQQSTADLGAQDIAHCKIDSSQGMEKPIVIFSLVQNQTLMFTRSSQRQNVATSRMRSAFFFVGCTDPFTESPIWTKWFNAAQEANTGHAHHIPVNHNCKFRVTPAQSNNSVIPTWVPAPPTGVIRSLQRTPGPLIQADDLVAMTIKAASWIMMRKSRFSATTTLVSATTTSVPSTAANPSPFRLETTAIRPSQVISGSSSVNTKMHQGAKELESEIRETRIKFIRLGAEKEKFIIENHAALMRIMGGLTPEEFGDFCGMCHNEIRLKELAKLHSVE